MNPSGKSCQTACPLQCRSVKGTGTQAICLLKASRQAATVQVIDDYSSRSFRLLAVAAGRLHGVDKMDLGHATIQNLESCCKLHLLGLTVLSNPLRPESKSTISELQDRWVGMCAQ